MQAAKEGQIDLVIMDVGLPDIDGREAVRMLRTQLRQHEASENAIFTIGPYTFLASIEAAAQSGGQ